MGHRGNKHVLEHLKTNIYINHFSNCRDCPLRIYTKKDDTIKLGIGNIQSNTIFVLPSYDTNADISKSLVELLAKAYNSVTGNNLYEDAYVTRIVKCSCVSSYDLYAQSASHCMVNIIYELCRLPFTKIVFCGDSYDHFKPSQEFLNIMYAKAKVYKIYSPGVLYFKDEEKNKNIFINQLSFVVNDFI